MSIENMKIYKKLLIIDGSYQLHRNLHVEELMNLKAPDGRGSGGVYGFLKTLLSAMNYLPSEYFPVVCWDSRVSQRRLDLDPNYKHYAEKLADKEYDKIASLLMSNPSAVDINSYSEDEIAIIKSKMNVKLDNLSRYGIESNPDEYLSQYVAQRNLVIDICNSLGIPSLKYTNWEGDDLITLLSRISESSIIMTDDSDLRQLVSENISVLRLLKDKGLVTKDDLDFDGYPLDRMIPIIKAITGDGSDNVPQLVFRLGYRTADKLARIIIDSNENPEVYLPEISKLSGKVIPEFIAAHDRYLINLQLVDLSYVPNDLDVVNYIISEVDLRNSQLDYLYTIAKVGSLGIKSLDVDSIVNYLVRSRQNLYLKEASNNANES